MPSPPSERERERALGSRTVVLLLKPTAGAAAATAAGAGAATAAAACAGTAGRSITICRGCQHHAQELVARLLGHCKHSQWECGARLQRASTTPCRLSALRAGLSTVAYSRGSEHTARACNACVCVQKQIRMDGDAREMQREIWGGSFSLLKVKLRGSR